MIPAFQENELCLNGYYEHIKPDGKGVPRLNSPITTRENILRALSGQKPYWYPMVGMAGGDYKPFRPRMFPDLFVAHDIMDGEPPFPFDTVPSVLEGWFDAKWRYVTTVGGPMIEPGTQKIHSINDWESLTWPDLDALDWEGCAKANQDYLHSELPIEFCIPTGYWERLMSLLEVADAAVMLIDEEQADACHAFLSKLTDTYVDLIKRVKQYFNADIILMHDDWGHQHGQFFSNETHQERIMPYFKRFVQTVHSLGMRFELHCCGKCENLVPHMAEAGVDLWCPQLINDIPALAKTYAGQGITFGVQLPIIVPGMPDEDELARKTARDFVAVYKDSPVAYINYGGSELLYKYMYEYSRKYLAG